jgi:hypothetical protein
MTSIPHCIEALEAYIERSGARLARGALPEWIQGRVVVDLITLRADLSPRQELLTLVHELTHWLVHRNARCGMDRTLFEYEAEAVEALVMARLELSDATDPDEFGAANPTDNLLQVSVARVRCASAHICGALRVYTDAAELKTQASIDLKAATSEEIIFKYEQHGVGNFLGSTEAF